MSLVDTLRRLVGSDLEVDVNNISKKIQSLNYKSAKSEILFTSILQLSSDLRKGSASNSLNNIFNNLQTEFSSLIVPSDRISKYQLYLSMIEKLPEVGQALSVYVDNIINPDETLKNSLVIKTDTDNKEISEDKIRKLIDNFQLEDELIRLIQSTLLFGDMYLGIDIIDVNKQLGELKDSTVRVFNTTFTRTKYGTEVTLTETTDYDITDSDNTVVLLDNDSTSEVLFKFFESEDLEDNKSLRLIRLNTFLPWTVVPIVYKNIALGYIVFPETQSPEQALVGNFTAHTKTLAYTATDSDTIVSQIDAIVSNFLDSLKNMMPNLKTALEDNPSLKLELAELFYKRNLEKIATSPQKIM